MDIGFIGASGLMGHGMAKHLQAKGHRLHLTVHRNTERVADLLAAGAQKADSPAALGSQCDVVFICVTGSPQVEAVMQGARPAVIDTIPSVPSPEEKAAIRSL